MDERFTVPWEPTEAMWGTESLARAIMMWMDFSPKTPRTLFNHLRHAGHEIPDWLRNEPEMKSLDHVPSKGTRCVLIYRAMLLDCGTALEASSRQEDVAMRALTWLAAQKTIDERMQAGDQSEWADASVERRIEMMGENKRAHDAAVLDARAALEPPHAKDAADV